MKIKSYTFTVEDNYAYNFLNFFLYNRDYYAHVLIT